MAIPKKYQNTIWDMQTIEPTNGAFVLEAPIDPNTPELDEDEINTALSGTFLSMTPDTPQNLKPIIFPTKLNAELYRQFIISQTPDHPVRDYNIRFMSELPTKTGYFMNQRFGTCPKCKQLAQYGCAENDEFFCENCNAPFIATKQPTTESE